METNKAVRIEVSERTSGITETMEGNIIYGCVMNVEEDSLPNTIAIKCHTFLSGQGIAAYDMADPIGNSITGICRSVSNGNDALELTMLQIIHRIIIKRLREVEKGEEIHGGN